MTAVLRITPPMLRDVRRPQRMVERTLVAGHGAHAGVVPLDDPVKQAHRALVRQVREEPRAIERRGDHEQRTVSGRPSR